MENGMRLKIYLSLELFKFESGKRLPFIKFFCFLETRLAQNSKPFPVRQNLQLLNDCISRIVLEPESPTRVDQTTAKKNRNWNVVPLNNGFQCVVTAMSVIERDDQRLWR